MISLLLGAGFSEKKGYPLGKQLNKKIISLKDEDFYISIIGTIYFPKEGDKITDSSDLTFKTFFLELIKYYSSHFSFHYEGFYDFCREILSGKEDNNFNLFYKDFIKDYPYKESSANLLSHSIGILNQVVLSLIVDGDGNKDYNDIPFKFGSEYPEYTGFIKCLKEWSDESIVNVHSLNHDLFFESLEQTEFINGKVSDGFDELGSPYYGSSDCGLVRVDCFNNSYRTRIRLYKLHGSKNQYPFYITGKGIDNYIKIKQGVDKTRFYKEVQDENGEYSYIEFPFSYHADFLTGTTSKIIRYKETFYSTLFEHFEANLKKSNKLVIIGYSGLDSEINRILFEMFDQSKNPIFLVNPKPSERTKEFCKNNGIKLIIKSTDNMSIEDFGWFLILEFH